MNILINTSNLRTGGGLQVADSIIRMLNRYKEHTFFVVIPEMLDATGADVSGNSNVRIIPYSQPLSLYSILTGRNRILDKIVEINNIEAVLTIFGPSRWKPRCFHLCGFAMPHIALPESPYWKSLSIASLLKSKLRVLLMKRDFKKNNDILWCENEYISQRLRQLFKGKRVNTITNNYNQIFDNPEEWDNSIKLPQFDGATLITITAAYPHKNLQIALSALEEIKRIDPQFKVRFVFTINQNQYPTVPDKFKENFVFLGPVSICQCPALYRQSDMMFQPSLLECFSATYAEAMKMEIPIITTDLGFAHSLCGDAAIYYSSTDAHDLAKCIIALWSDKRKRDKLVANGKKQLQVFDSAESRTHKLVKIIENNI